MLSKKINKKAMHIYYLLMFYLKGESKAKGKCE